MGSAPCREQAHPDRRCRWARGAATSSLLVLAACYGPEIARIELGDVGNTGEARVALEQGTRLKFGLTNDGYEYRGAPTVVLDVTLLARGSAVGTMSCTTFRKLGGAGRGSGSIVYHRGCDMTVPAGGADAIRATTRVQGGSASFDRLAIKVHRQD